jgi:carbon-monoxide dehydrogenase medium subunit
VAPTPIRCPQAEAVLKGQPLTEALIDAAADRARQECSPIDDVRGSAGYRRHMVKVLVRRGLQMLGHKESGE